MYGEATKQDSVRTVTLDALRRTLWAEYRDIRERKRRQWPGEEKVWAESNQVRPHENGEPLHPGWISRRFSRLVEQSGLPPIRLHDTRHLSATPALRGKADIKVVQERLGHSSHQNTSDTHTSTAHRTPRPPSLIPPARSYPARRRPPPARQARRHRRSKMRMRRPRQTRTPRAMSRTRDSVPPRDPRPNIVPTCVIA
ncbi:MULTISPECIES: tyrosine-type recombinase/integrase [Streptomyces]|uniref:tyrosine-type recombinase/integrase n=1 Tax=Streptomyces TaxID=1883 RepID=UPI00384D1C36